MNSILESYLRQEAAIKRYLKRFFTCSQDIDDVAQEVFIKVFATEMRTEVRHPKHLLFRAAKHAALSELAKKVRTTTDNVENFDDGPAFINENAHDSERILDGRRKLAALSRAVAELPPMCRQVFILRKIEGLPVKEVAARLGISVSTVEKHGALGIVRCARRMRELGYDPAEFGGNSATVKNAQTNSATAQSPEAGSHEDR